MRPLSHKKVGLFSAGFKPFFTAVNTFTWLPDQESHAVPPPAGAALPDRQGFESLAAQRLEEARKAGLDLQMTVLVIEGLSRLRQRHDPKQAEAFIQKLRALLGAVASQGHEVGQLGDDRFSIMHEGSETAESVNDSVTKIAQETGVSDSIQPRCFSIDLGPSQLSEDDEVRALIYAIRQAATDSSGAASLSALAGATRRLVADSAERVEKLRETIEKRNFEVVFQPIVDVSQEMINHFEALSRFPVGHDTQTLVKFAEQTGMIEDLDLVVVKTVLDNLMDQVLAGWNPRVAVNLSAANLSRPVFQKQLQQILEEYDGVRNQVLFEVTETVQVEDFKAFDKVLQALREAGHAVCLDDVGTGTTSLESLNSLTVDFVKIDGSLIRDVLIDQRKRQALESLLNLCRNYKVEVIGEHVENQEIDRILQKMGVAFGQGYHYGPPVAEYREKYEARTAIEPIGCLREGGELSWGR